MTIEYALEPLSTIEIRERPDLQNRFAEIYCKGFRGPPWNELWTLQTALAEVRFLLENDAVFVVARAIQSDDRGQQCRADSIVGWVTGLLVAKHHHNAQLLALGVPSDAMWLSDIVVDPSAQRQRLGTRLTRAFTDDIHDRGIATVASRTREDTHQYPIFLNVGYEILAQASFETGGVLQPQVVFLHRRK